MPVTAGTARDTGWTAAGYLLTRVSPHGASTSAVLVADDPGMETVRYGVEPHACFAQRAAGGLIDSRWCSLAHLDTLRTWLPGEGVLDSPDLTLYADDRIRIVFTPFDSANPKAKVVFVGLTPCMAQLQLALDETANAMRDGAKLDAALLRAKQVAAFAGSMRTNLISMLDGIGLHTALDLPSCSSLFGKDRLLADSTSAICHAVFFRDRNYSGAPAIDKHPVLAAAAQQVLAANLAVSPRALAVPLGRAAAQGVAIAGTDPARVLEGFPHPSGANGHRASLYQASQARMTETVRSWFGDLQVSG